MSDLDPVRRPGEFVPAEATVRELVGALAPEHHGQALELLRRLSW